MPAKKTSGSKSKTKRVSIKVKLVREHRAKVKALRQELRQVERDLRSLTGRRKSRQ